MVQMKTSKKKNNRKVVSAFNHVLFTFQVKLTTQIHFIHFHHSHSTNHTKRHCSSANHTTRFSVSVQIFISSGHYFMKSMKTNTIRTSVNSLTLGKTCKILSRASKVKDSFTHRQKKSHLHTRSDKMFDTCWAYLITVSLTHVHAHTSPETDEKSLKGLISWNVSSNIKTHACTHVQQPHTHTHRQRQRQTHKYQLLWGEVIDRWVSPRGSKVSHGSFYEAAFAAVVSRWRSACRLCDGLIKMGCRMLWRDEMIWEIKTGYKQQQKKNVIHEILWLRNFLFTI